MLRVLNVCRIRVLNVCRKRAHRIASERTKVRQSAHDAPKRVHSLVWSCAHDAEKRVHSLNGRISQCDNLTVLMTVSALDKCLALGAGFNNLTRRHSPVDHRSHTNQGPPRAQGYFGG